MTPDAVGSLNSGQSNFPYHVQLIKLIKSGPKVKVLISDGVKTVSGVITDNKYTSDNSDLSHYNFSILRIDNCVVSANGNKKLVLIANCEFLDYKFEERAFTEPEIMRELHEKNQQPPKVNTVLKTPTKHPSPQTFSTPTHPQAFNKQAPTSSPFQANNSILTVSAINAYSQTMRVRARCTQKSEMRPFKNGQGKLFSCVLVDATGDIKSVAFNDDADRLFTQLEENKIYIFNKFRAKPADQKYNKTSHAYEITFNKESEVTPVEEDDSVPKATFQFVENIASIINKSQNDVIDLIAIVHDCADISTITKKSDGSELTKRDITLVDPSDMQIRLTLWGETASSFQQPSENETMVLSAKSLKVGEYFGRSLSSSFNSVFIINENNKHTHDLKHWYESGGKNTDFIQFNNENENPTKRKKKDDFMWIHPAMSMPIDDVKGFWFTCVVHIGTVFVKSLYYAGCPSCNKKIVQVGDKWECAKCNETHDEPRYKYIAGMNVIDASGQNRVQCFDGPAAVVFGLTANEMNEIIKDMSDAEKEQFVQQRTNQKQFKMKCVIKMDEYNGENRKKVTAQDIEEVDYIEYGDRLQSLIDNYAN